MCEKMLSKQNILSEKLKSYYVSSNIRIQKIELKKIEILSTNLSTYALGWKLKVRAQTCIDQRSSDLSHIYKEIGKNFRF